MDNLVLIRVAAAVDARLREAELRTVREEAPHRVRLIFEAGADVVSLLVSLRPGAPWIGRPATRWEGPRRTAGVFGAAVRRALAGIRVEGCGKPPAERVVTIRFAGGRRLVAELLPHRANLILIDADGRIGASARRPRSDRERLEAGAAYRCPDPRPGVADPFAIESGETDRLLASSTADGRSAAQALRTALAGIDRDAAAMVLEEAGRTGRTPGRVLRDRLDGLLAGELDPVIQATEDPFGAAREDRLPREARLLPWPPDPVEGALPTFRGADAAATAGLFHDLTERTSLRAERAAALVGLLRHELGRLRRAGSRVAGDLARFEEPERHRRRGEALLAGLGQARRAGEVVFVPDPYDAEGPEIGVPVAPGVPLTRAANELFERHRRARRGLERARRRQREVLERRATLERLAAELEDAGDPAEVERALRDAGLPVGLAAPTRRARARLATARPRLEGVRVVTSPDGWTILVGRSGPDNHRMTFRLAAAEDFWLHALGHPGAHVIVRNPDRIARPPRATLVRAAALAAWFSEARGEPAVDVQWTRRKHVRHPRGAAPGTVLVKRFDTVRVRPAPPEPVA